MQKHNKKEVICLGVMFLIAQAHMQFVYSRQTEQPNVAYKGSVKFHVTMYGEHLPYCLVSVYLFLFIFQ